LYLEESTKELVRKIIKKFGTSNPNEIVESLKNVDFEYEKLTKNIKGYYKYISEKKQIIRVDEDLTEWERIYVLWHELAHYFLKHREFSLTSMTHINKTKKEYEADLFATYSFILQMDIIKDNIDNNIIPNRAKELASNFLN
jgi:Zn-dependent peptidase ImmA (M78 family)